MDEVNLHLHDISGEFEVKKLAFLFLGVAASFAVSASEGVLRDAPYAHDLSNGQSSYFGEKLDIATAPIKSRQQLQQHLAMTPDSPLYKLTPYARGNFVNSLVFTSRGLGSYSYVDLSGLSVSEAYAILSLIGAQSTIASVPGLKAESSLDQAISDRADIQAKSGVFPAAKPKDQTCYVGPEWSGCGHRLGTTCMDGC